MPAFRTTCREPSPMKAVLRAFAGGRFPVCDIQYYFDFFLPIPLQVFLPELLERVEPLVIDQPQFTCFTCVRTTCLVHGVSN